MDVVLWDIRSDDVLKGELALELGENQDCVGDAKEGSIGQASVDQKEMISEIPFRETDSGASLRPRDKIMGQSSNLHINKEIYTGPFQSHTRECRA